MCLSHLPRTLDGADYGLGFVDGFLMLQLGHAVGYSARAGLHEAFAADGKHGTDGDAMGRVAHGI